MAYIAMSDLAPVQMGLGQNNPMDAVLTPIGAGLSEGIKTVAIIIFGALAVSAVLGGVVGYKLGGWTGALVGAPLVPGVLIGGYSAYWAMQPKPAPDPRYPTLPTP